MGIGVGVGVGGRVGYRGRGKHITMILASSDGSTLVSSTRKGTHLCEKQAAAVWPAGQPEHICRYRPRLTEANGPRRELF